MEQGSGYLGGGGALSLQTQMLLGDTLANILGQGCTLSMPLWCLQHDVWSSRIVQSEIILQQSLQLAGQIPDILACERFKIAEPDLVADWGHKSTFWVIFLAVKKCLKIDFSFSSHLFQSLDCNTNETEHPSHATQSS